MQTITAKSAQVDFQKLLQSTIQEHRQYRIASEHGGVVMLSEEDYESLVETLELLSVPGLYESVKEADTTYSMEDVFNINPIV